MQPIFNTEFINILAYLYAWLQHVDTLLPVQRVKKGGPSLHCKKQQSEAQKFMEVKKDSNSSKKEPIPSATTLKVSAKFTGKSYMS